MLSLFRDFMENLIHIGEVEIAAKTKVLGPPVVPAQERMYKRKATLAGGRIPEVAHIDVSCKRQAVLGISGIGQLLGRKVLELSVDILEDFGGGTAA